MVQYDAVTVFESSREETQGLTPLWWNRVLLHQGWLM